MTALLHPDETLHVGVNVIVRPGDEHSHCDGTGLVVARDGGMVADRLCAGTGAVAPKAWVALTGPCPTCKDSGWPGYVPADVSEMSGTALNDCGAGAPFKRCPNPDCRDGRRIVPLYTECPMEWWPGDKCDGWILDKDGDRAGKCDRCEDGHVLVGRGSIQVVPVVTGDDSFPDATHITVDALGAVMLWVWDGSDFDPVLDLTLDPSPVPGRDWGIVIDCVEVAS